MEKRAVKPASPSRATRAARTRRVARPMWVPAKRSQRTATVSAGSMKSTPFRRPRWHHAEHVLHRLGRERVALREGADAGVDGGEEDAERSEPGRHEGFDHALCRVLLAAVPLGESALGLATVASTWRRFQRNRRSMISC